LQQFLLGEIPDAQAEPLEQHLLECGSCAEILHRLAAQDALVKPMQTAPAPLKEPARELVYHLIGLYEAQHLLVTNEVTRILGAIEQGDPHAAEQLLPLVYDELRQLAAQKLAEKPGQTLQATALVHEAYLRLVDAKQPQCWNSRGHFFGAAAEAMRRILVDNARRKKAEKHGGRSRRGAMETAELPTPERDDQLLALDEALAKLEKHDPAKGQLVKLHWFAGLTIHETAELLGLSTATADRYWAYARAWLQREMQATEAEPR
jgi:RNA polymerase sigma factor (TIGR02999 family)